MYLCLFVVLWGLHFICKYAEQKKHLFADCKNYAYLGHESQGLVTTVNNFNLKQLTDKLSICLEMNAYAINANS